MCRQVCASAIVLAACAGPASPPPAEAEHAALLRFEELCGFLPQDMSSYWFSDARRRSPELLDPSGPLLIAHAARDFEPPTSLGVGACTFVHASRYAAGTTFAAMTRGFRAPLRPAETIAGQEIWEVPSSNGERSSWLARLEGPVLVRASSRELLANALARPGSCASVAAIAPAPIGDVEAASDLLFLRARPQPEFPSGAQSAGPSPATDSWVEVSCDGGRARCRVTMAPNSAFEAYQRRRAEYHSDFVVGPGYLHRGHHAFDVAFDEMVVELYLLLWFGLHVFI